MSILERSRQLMEHLLDDEGFVKLEAVDLDVSSSKPEAQGAEEEGVPKAKAAIIAMMGNDGKMTFKGRKRGSVVLVDLNYVGAAHRPSAGDMLRKVIKVLKGEDPRLRVQMTGPLSYQVIDQKEKKN